MCMCVRVPDDWKQNKAAKSAEEASLSLRRICFFLSEVKKCGGRWKGKNRIRRDESL
jgi:hypothetical protein